jgi:5-deoxy-glucuronate isomerase
VREQNNQRQQQHHFKAWELANESWSLWLTPKLAGWSFSGLRVADLRKGQALGLFTGEEEMLVLPLAGQGIRVECDGRSYVLAGRDNVFSGPTDFVYVPRDSEVVVQADADVRVAFPSARCKYKRPPRYGPASKVPVELRGAGQCSRLVRNFCAANVFETDKLIAVEVVTPGGNWSSYPPHKHDEHRPGEESVLEEIYYFEVSDELGMAYQRVYGTPERPIDVLAEVRTGDVVCIPYGWHGPSMAVPGYDLYYLNVMAGPSDERAWLICDHPDHGWIRDTWKHQPIDPRLTGGNA